MQFKGILFLIITAVIWGTSFVVQKLGMNYVEPFTFGATRFLLGALVLIPVILIIEAKGKRKRDSQLASQDKPYMIKDLLGGGTLCGLALFMGASLQQVGIIYTTAGKTGFITALYIVLVPLLGIFLGKKISNLIWSGVGIAVIGLYLLTVKQDLSIEKGDAIVLVGTIFWALQIIIVDWYVERTDGLKLSFVQFVIAGLLSAVAALVLENPSWESILACADLILYTAVFVVGVAYTLQILGQKYTNPTVAALIMSMESVFAVICGAVFLQETMGTREILGCIIMFAAVILTQVNPQSMLRAIQGQTNE